MPTFTYPGRAYYLIYTDGYLATETRTQLRYCQSAEQDTADRLRTLAASNENRPHPLHVWVLGNKNWLNHVHPEPFNSILAGEKSPYFRIVVIGEGTHEGFGQEVFFRQDLPDWLGTVGIRSRECDADKPTIKYASELLLGVLSDCFDEAPVAPTHVLDDLRVPYAFAGDR